MKIDRAELFYGVSETINIPGLTVTIEWDTYSYIKLLSPTTTGGIFKVQENSDVTWINPRIDSNNILGQNGIGTNSNAKTTIFGGDLINFKVANDFTGGKPIVNDGWGANISVSGTRIRNSHSGLNLKRDLVTDPSSIPLNFVGTDLIFENCDMVAYTGMKNSFSADGSLMSIRLDNFISLDCGSLGGVFVYDRASNVHISGTISSTGITPDAIFRGRAINCGSKIQVNQSADAIIDIDPLVNYSNDTTLSTGNSYDLTVTGNYDYFLKSDLTDITYPNRFMTNSNIKIRTKNDVGISIVTPATRNGDAILEIKKDDISFIDKVSMFNSKYSTISSLPLSFPIYGEGSWVPSLEGTTSSSGITYSEQTGRYIKEGNKITVSGTIGISSKGSLSGSVRIGNLPFNSGGFVGYESVGNLLTRYVTLNGYSSLVEISRTSISQLALLEVTSDGSTTTIADTAIADNSFFIFTITYYI